MPPSIPFRPLIEHCYAIGFDHRFSKAPKIVQEHFTDRQNIGWLYRQLMWMVLVAPTFCADARCLYPNPKPHTQSRAGLGSKSTTPFGIIVSCVATNDPLFSERCRVHTPIGRVVVSMFEPSDLNRADMRTIYEQYEHLVTINARPNIDIGPIVMRKALFDLGITP